MPLPHDYAAETMHVAERRDVLWQHINVRRALGYELCSVEGGVPAPLDSSALA